MGKKLTSAVQKDINRVMTRRILGAIRRMADKRKERAPKAPDDIDDFSIIGIGTIPMRVFKLGRNGSIEEI